MMAMYHFYVQRVFKRMYILLHLFVYEHTLVSVMVWYHYTILSHRREHVHTLTNANTNGLVNVVEIEEISL